MILLLSGCSPILTPLPTTLGSVSTPTQSGLVLPDLVVSSIYVAQMDDNGLCMGGFKIRVSIANQGKIAAENVNAVEMTTGQPFVIGRLDAGQSMTFYLSTSATSGNYVVVVDPQNLVTESNETNNSLSYLAPTPTPVLECMQSPTAVSTQMPTPGWTPMPISTPFPNSLDGLIYADIGVNQLWQIENSQQLKVADDIKAVFSLDGSKAVYEQGGDIWVSEPALNSKTNITHSSDRVDLRPRLWQSISGQKIVFSSASDGEPDRLYMSNLDGTGVETISSAHSLSPFALDPTGQSIAFDENGIPMLYIIGIGVAPFLSQIYNYQPAAGAFFASPSVSPNGSLFTWWVCKDDHTTRKCNLVVFTRAGEATYTVIHSYDADTNLLETWLPNPIWSADGQWIAFQTYAETNPYDIWIMHPDGSAAHQIDLALNPVWNPDGRHLAYAQHYPLAQSQPSTVNIIGAGSFNVETTLIPFGSFPVAWFGHAVSIGMANTPRFPLPSFSAPEGWGTFTNSTPVFRFRYPPDALINSESGILNVNVPFGPGTQMIEKSVRIESHIAPTEGCYALVPWQGVLQLNGTEFHYVEGNFWEHATGGLSFFQNMYTTIWNGYCVTVSLRIGVRDASGATGTTPLPPPSSVDTNPEILFDILSTFQFQ